jgi:sec-independent protein translocase protein TatB
MGMPPTIQMANLGMADSLILMVMALVVFGPRRLPQIGRQIGKLMYEFRKASNDFKFQMEEELRLAEDADRRKKDEERQAALALAAPKPVEVAPAPVANPVSSESTYTSESMVAATLAGPAAPPVEPMSEESYPRAETPVIQPPSSGEQVAAERPNRYFTPPEPASDSAPATSAPGRNGTSVAALAAIDSEEHPTTPVALRLPFDDYLPEPPERESSEPATAEPAPAEESAHHA